jgi:hypothetical protein
VRGDERERPSCTFAQLAASGHQGRKRPGNAARRRARATFLHFLHFLHEETQPESEMLTRTFDLPYRHRVTFIYSREAGFRTEWTPDLPRNTLRSQRATNRMISAYLKARSEFADELATVLGGDVLVASLSDGILALHEPHRPQTKH